MNSDRLVLASFNPSKRREVAKILSGTGIEVLSPPDFGIKGLPPEDGDTFLENALIKAVHVCRATGLCAVGDDSGLEVNALDGRPGVHSARYALTGDVFDDGHNDEANNVKLVSELAGIEDRTASFVCTAALCVPRVLRSDRYSVPAGLPDGVEMIDTHPRLPPDIVAFTVRGTVDGVITDEPRGTDGFGYDPIFFVPELGLTFAQVPGDRKNELSHRGQAFRVLPSLLRAL